MLEADQLQEPTALPNAGDPAPSLTRQQLEEIRDEWLRPLLMQLRHQSEEVGRLEMQVRQLWDDRARLTIERDALQEQLDEGLVGLAALPTEQAGTGFRFESLAPLLAQLKTAEGAVVTGIAIALGLWMGVGLLTWIALG